MYTVTLDGLVALVAALLIVAQLAWRLWRRRQPSAVPAPAPREPPADSPVQRTAAVRVATAARPPRAGPSLQAPGRRPPAGAPAHVARLRGRRALRQAYVALAVLGPCRAVQAQDPDPHRG